MGPSSCGNASKHNNARTREPQSGPHRRGPQPQNGEGRMKRKPNLGVHTNERIKKGPSPNPFVATRECVKGQSVCRVHCSAAPFGTGGGEASGALPAGATGRNSGKGRNVVAKQEVLQHCCMNEKRITGSSHEVNGRGAINFFQVRGGNTPKATTAMQQSAGGWGPGKAVRACSWRNSVP